MVGGDTAGRGKRPSANESAAASQQQESSVLSVVMKNRRKIYGSETPQRLEAENNVTCRAWKIGIELCGSRSFMRIFNTMSVPNLGQLR
jgi:hypothetical protein